MGGAVPRVEIPWPGGVLGASKTGGRTGEGGWRGRMAGGAVIMGAAVERSDAAVGRTPVAFAVGRWCERMGGGRL